MRFAGLSPSSPRPAMEGWGFLLAAMAIILLPTVLLWNPDARFYYDWHNHQWFVGYFGEYWGQHGRFPQVLHSAPIVGLPQPVFYGYTLYPLLGYISAFTGAAWALRVGILIAFALQYYAVWLAGRRMFGSRLCAMTIAASVTWAIYPLTNLYNRAALTEFFAICFLTAGIGFAIAGLALEGARARLLIWLGGGLGILAAGTHPPTALMGGAFVTILLVTLFCAVLSRGCRIRWDLLAIGLVVTGLGLVVLGPWIIANLELENDIYISIALRQFVFFPDRTDSFLGRFAPFPYDAMSQRDPAAVSTPYLEAQISFGLLMLAIAGSVRWMNQLRQRHAGSASGVVQSWLLCASGAWLVLVVALSLSRTAAGWFSGLAPYVQFPSRLTSHANLALLVIVFASVLTTGQRGALTLRYRVWVGFAFAIALVGVGIKLQHGAFVREIAREPRYAWRGDRSGLVVNGRLDAGTDYANVRRLPQLLPVIARNAKRADFPVGQSGTEFGQVRSVDVELAKPGWVITNAVVFRWARIMVNGAPSTGFEQAAHLPRWALYLPAGNHRLTWVWEPSQRWVLARSRVPWAVSLWLVGAALLAVAVLRGGRGGAFGADAVPGYPDFSSGRGGVSGVARVGATAFPRF